MMRAALALVGLLASVAAAAAQQTVLDAYNAPFLGETAMTVGTSYPPGRSLKIRCTAAGTVSFTYPDAGGSGQWDAVVGSQTIPVAVTSVTASTGTCTFSNLK